jgi:zinc protease
VVANLPILGQGLYEILEDEVPLPRLYMAWHSPAIFGSGDADLDVAATVLAEGKSSRLYRRLVYEQQVAMDVGAFQLSQELSGRFMVVVTARPDVALDRVEAVVREEVAALGTEGPTEAEMTRALNQVEAGFIESLERVGGFGGKADQLNRYYVTTGDPGYLRRDLARYQAADASSVRSAVGSHLVDGHTAVLSVVPTGRTDLAAGPS